MSKGTKNSIQWMIFVVVISICFSSLSRAGNRAMVEQNTKELDEINKKAVGEISDLPKDGTVKIKANAKYKEGIIQFNIYDKKVSDTEEKEIKLEKSSELNTGSVKEETLYINNSNEPKNREKQENDPKGN
ncbi:MAG: hypothetical protein EHJ94_01755 [Deltaproteobacteria bacterium]|nr:MAG: hypothetical protein EHJ94_01755 [Deltaproteobacteria bacterium]